MPRGVYNRVKRWPRANCHVCGKDTSVRGGLLAFHSNGDPDDCCPGSRQKPRTEVRGRVIRRGDDVDADDPMRLPRTQ